MSLYLHRDCMLELEFMLIQKNIRQSTVFCTFIYPVVKLQLDLFYINVPFSIKYPYNL